MPAVGFDLDMTLVDTGAGIHAALLELSRETGRPIDADDVVAHLGPPVVTALAPYFPAEELAGAVERFRVHMARVGVVNVTALPGAATAVEAARSLGFRAVVVTSKIQPLAVATLHNAGVAVDEVVGDVWAADKAAPLVARDAVVYVGDHPGDMQAARAAGIIGVGVTTGASTADELVAAGADHVLTSLERFPSWLRRRLAHPGKGH